MNRTRHALASTVLVGAMTLGLSACGGGTPAVCDDMDQLQRSLASLKDVQLEQGALSELSTRWETVKTDARQLEDDASKEFADEVDAVKKAGDALGVGIDKAKADPSVATLSALQPQIAALSTALGNLTDSLSSTC